MPVGAQTDYEARRKAPGPPTTLTVGTLSTAAQDISTSVGKYVTFQAKGDTIYFRFGGSNVAAATTDDMHLTAGSSERYYITDDRTHFRAISDSADNRLIRAETSD